MRHKVCHLRKSTKSRKSRYPNGAETHEKAPHLSSKMRRIVQTAVLIVVTAVVYFCTGTFGLSLAFVNSSASAVWPPSGIALAAVLLWGYRLWPGILLGALFVNFATQGSLATALAIAAGNTLEV